VGPEDLTVIGYTGDLLADIYTAKCDAYLHFTVVLNDGGKGAQFERSLCAISCGILSHATHTQSVVFFNDVFVA